MQDKNLLAFILALIGGLLALAMAFMMGIFLTFATAAAGAPAAIFVIFGWLVLGGVVGGILMLVAAPKLRRPADAPRARTLAMVGGAITLLGGNLLAGALGIVAGAILLGDAPPAAPPPAPAPPR